MLELIIFIIFISGLIMIMKSPNSETKNVVLELISFFFVLVLLWAPSDH